MERGLRNFLIEDLRQTLVLDVLFLYGIPGLNSLLAISILQAILSNSLSELADLSSTYQY